MSSSQSDRNVLFGVLAEQDNFASVEFRQLLGRFVDVCNAIEYAHSRGVLHRDLKPGNIMFGKYCFPNRDSTATSGNTSHARVGWTPLSRPNRKTDEGVHPTKHFNLPIAS